MVQASPDLQHAFGLSLPQLTEAGQEFLQQLLELQNSFPNPFVALVLVALVYGPFDTVHNVFWPGAKPEQTLSTTELCDNPLCSLRWETPVRPKQLYIHRLESHPSRPRS